MDGVYVHGVHTTPIVVASISGLHSNEVVDCQIFNDILPGMKNAQWQQLIDLLGNSDLQTIAPMVGLLSVGLLI